MFKLTCIIEIIVVLHLNESQTNATERNDARCELTQMRSKTEQRFGDASIFCILRTENRDYN